LDCVEGDVCGSLICFWDGNNGRIGQFESKMNVSIFDRISHVLGQIVQFPSRK